MDEPTPKLTRISLTKGQLSTARGRELFTILSEISADGVLTNDELRRLHGWLSTGTKDKLPAEAYLFEAMRRILANGEISAAERIEMEKEVERCLPPSQRAEARAARERVEALIAESKTISQAPTPELRREAEAPAPLSRHEEKVKIQADALKRAVAANAARAPDPKGTHIHFNIPDRRPYEPSATMKQKDFLWGLGVQDQALLEALGKWQASAMIDQIKQKQNGSSTGCIVVLAIAIVIIFGYLLSQK